MKILVVTDHISKDFKNGTWEFAYKFSKYASNITEVSIVTLKPKGMENLPNFEQDGNLKIYRYPDKFKIISEIKKIEHDVAFVHTVKSFALYRLSIGFKSKPIISMIQGTSYLERLNNVGKKDLKYYALWLFEIYRVAASDVLLFASKYMMFNSVRSFSAFRKSAYLPLAIDAPEKGDVKLPDSEKYIQKNIEEDVKNGYKIIFCIRRIVSRTGVLHLVDMMNFLKDYKVKLYIGGTGTHLEALKKKVEANTLSDKIKVLGLISDEAKNWIYKRSFLSIVPTRTLEGFCISMLESMNYGCPPIVTPVGGMFEFMKDNDLLDLVTSGITAQQMAKKVEDFIKDKGKRDLYSKKCKEVVAKHNYDDITRRFVLEMAYMLERAGKLVNFKDEVKSGFVKKQ